MMNRKTYFLEKSPLYRLENKRILEQLIGLEKGQSRKGKIEELCNYSHFEHIQNKKNRMIENPDYLLKKLQKKLLKLLQRIETPNWLKSGKKGCSYIDNAAYHKDNPEVLTVDIMKFYPSCKQKYVFQMFCKTFKMSEDVAGAMTRLVTIDGHLPTGSPTSQILAYWTFNVMFNEIKQLCDENNLVFSLYVDDMTFSSHERISEQFITDLNIIINRHGLKLKKSKQKYYGKFDFKLITGVAIDKSGELQVKNGLRHNVKKEFDEIKDLDSKKQPVSDKKIKRLKGLLSSAKQVEGDIYPSINKYLENRIEEIK